MSIQSFHLVALNTLLLLSLGANSFCQSLQWAKQIGGAGWDEGTSIATDQNDNVYVVGLFRGTVDFNPGAGVFNLTSVDEKDAFICKLDSDGNFLWAKQYGDSANIDENSSLGIDSLGNLYTTNSFVGTADFDPGPGTFYLTSVGWDRDIFIQKLDANGDFLWAKQISGQQSDLPSPTHATTITVDIAGNQYITGYFDQTVDFDPGVNTFELTAFQQSDIFICKLDSSGNFVWAKQFGGTEGGVGYQIALDNSNNIYSTGIIGGTVDFDPGPDTFFLTTSAPFQPEIYVSKLDSQGNFVWAKAMGPGGGLAIAVDDNSNVYSSGWASSGYTTFINKLDSSGNQIWAKQLGGAGITGNSIVLDNSGNVYTTGTCYGTNDFDPGPEEFNLTGGASDSYINKLDPSGNFVWAGLFTGTSQVWAKALDIDEINHIYATGFYDGTADFDPSETTFNLDTPPLSYNIYILKMDASSSVGLLENTFEDEVRIYPNPTEGNLMIEFERELHDVTIILRNMVGQVIDRKSLSYGNHMGILIEEVSGIYFLEILNEENQRVVARILKR